MGSDHASTVEATDPYCLRSGEAAALLKDHPWRRFVVLGDSIAEGVGDPVDGYANQGFADRIAAELSCQRPGLVYLNLGARSLRAAQVRAAQIGPALAFEPDLALLACGGNDALRPSFDPDAMDREVAAILVVMADYPAFPQWYRPVAVERMRLLARHTNALAAALGTIHADLSLHPLGELPQQLLSRDGLHANARSHAICAAEAIRRLGAHLGNAFTGAVAH